VACIQFTSLVVLPWVLALSLVDHLLNLYATLPFFVCALPFGMGMGWGVAQNLFGISVRRLGLALAYAVIVGLGAVLGTLVAFSYYRMRAGITTLSSWFSQVWH
jgi:L-rhamnose-H+ transport protein